MWYLISVCHAVACFSFPARAFTSEMWCQAGVAYYHREYPGATFSCIQKRDQI